MNHLPNTTTAPPGGWRYFVPQTSRTITATNLPELVTNIRSHLQANGQSMPHNIAELIEEYICGQPESREYCGGRHVAVGKPSPSSGRGLFHTFHAAIQCLKTLVSNRAGSGERPTQEMAEIRAATCAACPENTEIAPCSACGMGSLIQLVQKLVGVGKTSRDSELKFCQVCHCNNRAKIWTKHEAIWKHMPQSQKKLLPENCWLVKEARDA